ncbi:hypothetical protein C8J57DRAFT_1306799 [Mycena rebaudengoi]|nr:hypothetical protein C8J57DRAFT_1306799 [Mycena rebaudengoi]
MSVRQPLAHICYLVASGLDISLAVLSQVTIIRILRCQQHGMQEEPVGFWGLHHSERRPASDAYSFNVPSAYNTNVAARQLILPFHGNGKTASSQEEDLSDFNNETWNPNAISVYAQGADVSIFARINNKLEPTQSCTQNKWAATPFSVPAVDDIVFIKDLLSSLEASYCIDTKHIWAVGKSIGGGFCNVFACSTAISARFVASCQ